MSPAPEFVAGTLLPEVKIEVTPTFIVSTALATRDFQDVHHDRDRAVVGGSKDIFVNILTTTGLVQRYVSEWAGPAALVRGVSVRLGVPCYAYETLVLSGQVTGREGTEAGTDLTVAVVGRVSNGEHVSGTVRLSLAEKLPEQLPEGVA
jgi:acyl dehydratase